MALDVQIHKSLLSFLPLSNIAASLISVIEAWGQPRQTRSGVLSVVFRLLILSLIISSSILITSRSLNESSSFAILASGVTFSTWYKLTAPLLASAAPNDLR